jgi:hypothetical protein
MPTTTAISASPESPNTAAFINAIHAGYRVLRDAHGWAVGLRATVVESVPTKPAAIKAVIKHHSLDRVVQLHYAAAVIAPTAPAVADAFTLLARRVEAQTPALAEDVAEECSTTDAIIALAEFPTSDLSGYTAIELHEAAQVAAAQRDAAAGRDMHEMMRLAAIARELHAEVDRRCGNAPISATTTTRNQDRYHRRAAKAGRR